MSTGGIADRGERVPRLYGLDIETDTATGGLDPGRSRVLAVALATPEGTQVFHGPEASILARLDAALAASTPGVLATWNGGGFDLPFLAERARRRRLPLGLSLWPDPRVTGRPCLPHHDVAAYCGSWHGHGHVDAYRLWRRVRLALGVSASLKSVASQLGLPCPDVDASRVHELADDQLAAYVARDAELAAELARRAWAMAHVALDPAPPAPATARTG